MSNLIIPSKIKSTAPKPTKTQLVEALLIKAKELHDKEEKRKTKLRDEIEKKLLEIGLKDFAKATHNKFSVNVNAYTDSAQIQFRLTSSECKKLIKEYSELKYEYYHEHDAKKKILEALKPANPLLGNSMVEKSLEDLILQIFNNINTVEAIEA